MEFNAPTGLNASLVEVSSDDENETTNDRASDSSSSKYVTP